MSEQKINVTNGAAEYTWPETITETNGKDISADAVLISLGTASAAGAWVSGVLTRPSPSAATIKMLVDSTVPLGTYYVWVRVTDSPEVVPRRGHKVVVI